MNREEKASIVADLTDKLNHYSFVYVTDASELTADSTNDLRRMMHKQGVKMHVAKNTLVKIAMQNTDKDYGALVDTLKGSTALLFSEDGKTPAKAIKEFRKQHAKPYLKGAYIDSDVFIGDDQIDMLSKIKSKSELVGEVIGLLQSPARNVISALQSSGGKLAGLVKTLSEKPE